jgi:hypothetical protein
MEELGMMWITFICGALLFIANVDDVGFRTERGVTAFVYTMIGVVFGVVSTLYLSGVVS